MNHPARPAPLQLLHNRIDLASIPFTERGSRLLVQVREGRLGIRLAERLEAWADREEPFRTRPSFVDGIAFTAGSGGPLPWELESYPDRLLFITPAGRFGLAFADEETLCLQPPAGSVGLRFRAVAEQAQLDARGGVLQGGWRRLAYTTDARIRRNQATPVEAGRLGVHLELESDGRQALLVHIAPEGPSRRELRGVERAFEDAERRWLEWFASAPEVEDRWQSQYAYAWWVMAAGLLSPRGFLTREGMVPSKLWYIGVWHWDAFFHALAYRHTSPRLAEDQIRLLLDHQLPNGMIPDAIHDEGIVTHLDYPVDGDVTKPPLMGWAVLKIHELTGNDGFLAEVYEPIRRWQEWWLRESADPNGLAHYAHPFSSGLDDSPLWDGGLPVVSPDLNTYLTLQAEALARMAEILGRPGEARHHQAQAARLAGEMDRQLWDAGDGLYRARRGGEPVRALTPFSLLPLWTGRLPAARARRLVAHLRDPHTFWTRYPLPTVARSDPHHDPQQMWRGPTWANVNYLFVEALNRSGETELARQLRERTLELVMGQRDIFEYYHPETGQPPPGAAPTFGWTSAVFIDLAIQASRQPSA